MSAVGGGLVPHSVVWSEAFNLKKAPIRTLEDSRGGAPVFSVSDAAEEQVRAVAREERYQKLDRAVHLAITAARGTFEKMRELKASDLSVGCISIGSSRGPTSAIEHSVLAFAQDGKVNALTSPVTTAGNISSWVAQEYLANYCCGSNQGSALANVGTSMTCSSALHSLLVARGFVMSGMAQAAMFGGSEACLTPYTVAQLRALRIYGEAGEDWPCRPMASSPDSNSVVLGEGAGTAMLLCIQNASELCAGDLELSGIGWSLESITSPTGISEDAVAFRQAMAMALNSAPSGRRVSAVVAHAPGTRRGDRAEVEAIRELFGDVPVISTKYITGHSYGASAMVSLGLADALLSGVPWRGYPFNEDSGEVTTFPAGESILINSAGFGGNAISILVNRPLEA